MAGGCFAAGHIPTFVCVLIKPSFSKMKFAVAEKLWVSRVVAKDIRGLLQASSRLAKSDSPGFQLGRGVYGRVGKRIQDGDGATT